MTRSIVAASMMIACQLVIGSERAVALDSTDLARQIQVHGCVEFVRSVIDRSDAMKYLLSPMERNEILDAVSRYTGGTLKEVNASTAFSLEGMELSIAQMDYDTTENILTVLSTNSSMANAFAVRFLNLEDSSIISDLEPMMGLLDDVQVDSTVIDAVGKAVNGMFHSKDPRIIDEYERGQASKAKFLPLWISRKLSVDKQDYYSNLKKVLELLDVNSEVKYLGTKQVVGKHRISLFGAPSSAGPVIYGLHLVFLDTGPVAIKSWLVAGVSASPYFGLYARVFSPVGKSKTIEEAK